MHPFPSLPRLLLLPCVRGQIIDPQRRNCCQLWLRVVVLTYLCTVLLPDQRDNAALTVIVLPPP